MARRTVGRPQKGLTGFQEPGGYLGSVKEAAEDEFIITDSSRAWKKNQSP